MRGLEPIPGPPFDRQEAVNLAKFVQRAYELQSSNGKDVSLPFGYVLAARIYADDPNVGFASDNVIGYIATSPTSPHDIVVAFRGTESGVIWLNSIARGPTFLPTTFPFVHDAGSVATQFSSYYSSIRAGSDQPKRVVDQLRSLAKDGNVSALHITGHGLGSVLATLLAIDLAGNDALHGLVGPPVVYTFSGPRVGDPIFASKYDQLVPNTWRIVNAMDIVPQIPLPPLFQHVGRVYTVHGGFRPLNIVYSQDLQRYLHGLDPNEPAEKEENLFTRIVHLAGTFYDRHHQSWWFTPVTTIGSIVGAYLTALAALVILAWRKGSTVFSRTWLAAKATHPLLVAPGLGRWAMFLGYRSRLLRYKAVSQAAQSYFGLPAAAPDGTGILPNATNASLVHCIAEATGEQQPVLVVGNGGAGKSTLLARIAYLALKNDLPKALKRYLPVLIPASYYTESLTKAIADTLRERDGIAVTEELVTAQLQSGRFLILFDGITEVAADDKQKVFREVLRTAANFDYRASRFIIASRPMDGLGGDGGAFHLRPLTAENIERLLPRYQLGTSRENRIRQQFQSFGAKPIEPLLFAMILGQSSSEEISQTRAGLYEAYFRRLLRAESDGNLWKAWRAALEHLAEWFLLDTGNRGSGLPHAPLVNRIVGRTIDGKPGESLIDTLRLLFRFPEKDALELIQKAESSGVLIGERRWRFSHDTFEEYFAASRLMSIFEDNGRWPALDKWIGNPEREQDFSGVLDFVREMCDDASLEAIAQFDLPTAWKERLHPRG